MEEGVSNISLLDKIKDLFATGEQDINTYSPLVLAYIGDCIYELVVRSIFVQKLHKKTTAYVKAATQANIITAIMEDLTEDEKSVYKRARNSKQHTTPKNGSLGDYHKATGFEAVMGYLYLTDKEDRMLMLLKKGFEMIKDGEN